MTNFEKYRKKKNIVKTNIDDLLYNKFIEYLKDHNLTQQFFIENMIKNVLESERVVNMYSLRNYVESVENFINDSRDWYELDYYKFYVSTENGSWVENSDNSDGGLDVSWAFKKDPTFEEIREKFIGLLKDFLNIIIENDINDFDISINIF